MIIHWLPYLLHHLNNFLKSLQNTGKLRHPPWPHNLMSYLYFTMNTDVSAIARFTMKKIWISERTLLHRSRTWNLRSCAGNSMGIRAANHTTTAWRQNLHKLDVLKAAVEMQVQSWKTNSEFGSKCKYWGSTYRITIAWVIMISFYLETNLFKRGRDVQAMVWATKKKDTSDSFELHLKLENSRGIAVVLIDFWFSKMSLI